MCFKTRKKSAAYDRASGVLSIILSLSACNIAIAANLPLQPQSQLPVGSTTVSVIDTTSLPNAYALLQKIDAQQLEIARLSGQIEDLQSKYSDLSNSGYVKQNDSISDSQTAVITAQVREGIYNELHTQLYDSLSKKLTEELTEKLTKKTANTPSNLTMAPIDTNQKSSRPYLNRLLQPSDNINNPTPLLTNIDIPARELAALNRAPSSTSMTNTSSSPIMQSRGDKAYADAYLALTQNGADAAINKMKTFIATYIDHPKIPNAHYWLGEFYLKQKPPQITMAKVEFIRVISDYKDYPANDSQSKALFRLAMFAKEENRDALAKRYSDQLLAEYPQSKEADLAKALVW